MNEIAEAYRATRERTIEVALAGDASAAVPACPIWTVKDALAHLAGICDDILNGNLEGLASEAWTQAQVDARIDASLSDVAAEWRDKGARIDDMLPAFSESGARQLVFDVVTHEHDIRHAVRRPGARDTDAVAIGLGFVAPGLGGSIAERGLPALRVRAGNAEWTFGENPAASLTADPFELLRALAGRRSASQILSFDWTGDPAPYLPAFQFGPFTTRPEPLEK